jgi:hypothetical protein
MIAPLFAVLLLLLRGQPVDVSPRAPSSVIQASPGENLSTRRLAYVMRGEVRFLGFWVGRDNVGGGSISLSRGTEGIDSQFWQDVEVLFGSNPERVPGKVNLWGYGRERSRWKRTASGGQELLQSVFEGFMHPRDEIPPSVQAYMKSREGQRSFLFRSVRSEVNQKEATTEARYFVAREDFDYRAPNRLITRYQENASSTPPEFRRTLQRQSAGYETPAGFLTAAQGVVAVVVDEAARRPTGWTRFRPSVRYSFHAKPYRLSVTRLRAVARFEAPFIRQRGMSIQNVAQVDFRMENLKQALAYDFTLWVALDGPMRGLPLRIAYKPSWWLRLRLDLTTVS